MFKVILFYKYIPIEDPRVLLDEQKSLCERLNLRGRVIIATEGINATLEGQEKDISQYQKALLINPLFRDVHFKISDGSGQAFPKLSVKVRNEIVAGRLGKDDIKPWEVSGKYIDAETLHSWIHSRKEFYI